MKRIITVVLLVILIALLLCSCRNPLAAKPFTNITSFRVASYASGAWGEYNFDLTENGNAEITYFFGDSWGYEEDQNLIATVSADYLVELTEILNSHNLAAWNGYFKYDSGIIDGHGFIIELTTDSGQEFYAHGYEKYPRNYEEVSSAIYSFFDQFEYTDKPEEPKSDVYEGYDYVFTSTFSYEDDVKQYKNGKSVIRDGFANIGEVPVEDPVHAIELAKAEIYEEYDTVDVSYDIHSRVYRVTFSTDGVGVNVYISKEGCTLMIAPCE